MGTVPVSAMGTVPECAMGTVPGKHPVGTICDDGYSRLSRAISFSQSFWALAVTLQPRTIIISTGTVPVSTMGTVPEFAVGTVPKSDAEREVGTREVVGTVPKSTISCPAEAKLASMSRASAWFNLQPNVTKAMRILWLKS